MATSLLVVQKFNTLENINKTSNSWEENVLLYLKSEASYPDKVVLVLLVLSCLFFSLYCAHEKGKPHNEPLHQDGSHSTEKNGEQCEKEVDKEEEKKNKTKIAT
jgi:hypothetical protein